MNTQNVKMLIQDILELQPEEIKELRDALREDKTLSTIKSKETNKIHQSILNFLIYFEYLMFDLEATKRERNNLKIILDFNRQEDDDEPNTSKGAM